MKIIIVCLISICCISSISIKNTKSVTDYNPTNIKKLDSCFFKEKRLFGTIKLVENACDADVKVKIVNSFSDLKVKFVESFPDTCGEWQIVDYHADLKVFITESFPDITIQPVTSFPGLP